MKTGSVKNERMFPGFETSKKKVEKFRGADHTSVIDEGSKLIEVTMK